MHLLQLSSCHKDPSHAVVHHLKIPRMGDSAAFMISDGFADRNCGREA